MSVYVGRKYLFKGANGTELFTVECVDGDHITMTYTTSMGNFRMFTSTELLLEDNIKKGFIVGLRFSDTKLGIYLLELQYGR